MSNVSGLIVIVDDNDMTGLDLQKKFGIQLKGESLVASSLNIGWEQCVLFLDKTVESIYSECLSSPRV